MLAAKRVVALVVAFSTCLGLSVASVAPAIASPDPGDARVARPTPPSPLDLSQVRLHPENQYGFLTEDQVRGLFDAGKVPDPSVIAHESAGVTESAGRSAAAADQASVTSAGAGALSGQSTGGSSSGTSYSINGTVYAVGQSTSGGLPGNVTDVAFGGDGSSAVVEYGDSQWAGAIFGGAPWQHTSVGVKSLNNGYFAPVSFDAAGRAVPAMLLTVSPNGRWVVYAGPDMNLMYIDPANLGKVYIVDVQSLHVTEMSAAAFGSTQEHPFIPGVTSITNDGSRFTWGECVAVVGGSICAAQVPGSPRISADGSTIVYQTGAGELYRTGAGGGTGTLISTNEYGTSVSTPTTFQAWAMSDDGSVVAYSVAEPDLGWEVTSSYVWASGEVAHFLSWAYDTWVMAVSGDGSLIGFSHPYGIDTEGFETRAAAAWNRITDRGLDLAVGPNNQPLPETETNYILGMSYDGSRVALMDYQWNFPYVFDRTGAPPPELMKQVPGTDAYGWNYDAWAADPVNTRTGAVELSVTDATLPSRGLPVQLTRSYSSDLSRSGRLGAGWVDSLTAASTSVSPTWLRSWHPTARCSTSPSRRVTGLRAQRCVLRSCPAAAAGC